MLITAIKTEIITPGAMNFIELLDKAVLKIEDSSVLAITSKIISLCENNVVPMDQIDKEQLVVQESDLYLPASLSKYGHHFTIANNILIPVGGVDESNGDNNYVLWPKDPQRTANEIRIYLKQRFNLAHVGVVITDSTCHPLRRGTTGIMLAHSGFRALNNYIGKPDLFGRPFHVSQADIAGGLAASAVLQMGEGSESTPLAILSDLPFVTFQDNDPPPEELEDINISLNEDLFAPFLTAVQWKKGARKQKK